MGKGAVRSQMDVRVCLRVRERRDVDLVLGQGMLAAGWHAQNLDAPGKFLVSAEGHSHPRRARAYLVTDEDVTTTANRYAPHRPVLDPLSSDAIDSAEDAPAPPEPRTEQPDPELTLWTALTEASGNGLSVPELMKITGMRRTWIYDRLQAHATGNRAQQVSRGRWRATDQHRTGHA